MPAFKRIRRGERTCAREDTSLRKVRGALELTRGIRAAAKARPRLGHRPDDILDVQVSAQQYNIARGIDHALLWGGLGGLASWAALPQTCRLLRSTERRYCVPVRRWADYEAVVWQRYCVMDLVTREKRFEIPTGGPGKPCRSLLCFNNDEHGVQLSLLQGLLTRARIRAIWFRDTFHRYWRDVILALMDAGLWGDVVDRVHCMNLPHGPWRSQKWWRELCEAMDEHFLNNSSGNPIFQAMFQELQAEMLRDPGAQPLRCQPHSAAAYAAVWGWLQTHSSVRRQGFRVKTKTWFELFKRLHETQQQHYRDLYMFVVLVHSQGHFPTVDEMPVWGACLPPSLIDALPGDAEPGPPNAGRRAAGSSLPALRARCKNACVVAAHIQGQADSWQRGEILQAVARAVWTAFAKDVEGMKAEDAVERRYIAYAKYGQAYVVGRIWNTLRCTRSVEHIFGEFSTPPPRAYSEIAASLRARVLPPAAAAADDSPPPRVFPLQLKFPDEHALAAELAALHWQFASSLVAHRAMSMSHYRDIPPGQFALLRCDDARVAADGLGEQRLNWETLVETENRMHNPVGGKAVMDVVKTVGFLHHDVPREILGSLAQHDFAVVPPDDQAMLGAAFRGFGHSRINEKSFNTTKNAARRASRINLGKRVQRHYVPCLLKTMTREFERAEVDAAGAQPPSGAPGIRTLGRA